MLNHSIQKSIMSGQTLIHRYTSWAAEAAEAAETAEGRLMLTED